MENLEPPAPAADPEANVAGEASWILWAATVEMELVPTK